MQLKIKRTIPAAVVIVAVLLFSNGASAAGSTLHDLFSIDHNLEIDGGDVSADCPAGSVCQKLPGSGSGLLLRSVTNTSTGISFLQSIIAETLPGGGLFANEQDLRRNQSVLLPWE